MDLEEAVFRRPGTDSRQLSALSAALLRKLPKNDLKNVSLDVFLQSWQ